MAIWTARWACSATPNIASRGLGRVEAEYGFDEFICYFNQGGLMDHALAKQLMTLFAQEVMPHFR
jgi:hypothetical protein